MSSIGGLGLGFEKQLRARALEVWGLVSKSSLEETFCAHHLRLKALCLATLNPNPKH